MFDLFRIKLLVFCLIVSSLSLSYKFNIISAQQIDSKPFVVESDPLNCNFRVIFHHIDSSEVYNCSVMGTDQFCCKNEKFFISISHCGKLLSPSSFNGVFLKRDCDIFFLSGNLIDSKGYDYDGIIYCGQDQLESISKRITYFRYFRYDEKSILIKYKLLNIPEYWSFRQVYEYSIGLSDSIEINRINLWN